MYIPPEGSKYTKIGAFEECELELLELLSCNDSFVCVYVEILMQGLVVYMMN